MEAEEFAFGVIADLLEERTGQKLTSNRRWRIGTALAGLFREHGFESIEQLVVQLTRPNQERLATDVVEALLNNETYFFRDRIMFDHLAQRLLPEIARKKEASRRLTIWSVGCSTGQEAISLALLFAEQRSRWMGWTIDILGSDISTSVIERARKGVFTPFQVQRGLGVGQMLAYFEETRAGWQVSPEIGRMIRYQVHNLLDVPPLAGQADLVLCRNVLLYFDVVTRARAFDQLAKALLPGGYLMLGAGETVVGQTEKFMPCSDNPGFYRHAAAKADKAAKVA